MRKFLSLDNILPNKIEDLVAMMPKGKFCLALNSNDEVGKSFLFYDKISELRTSESIGSFDALQKYLDKTGDWTVGYLSYNLKDDLENLSSKHENRIGFPDMIFCQPRFVIIIENGSKLLGYLPEKDNIASVLMWVETISKPGYGNPKTAKSSLAIQPRESKETYLKNVNRLLEHIHQGDIYELNYCQEFYAEKAEIHPAATYKALNVHTNAPFSCFMQFDEFHLLSASPERFIQKKGKKILSQPIKGTMRRGATSEEDEQLKTQLKNDPKEISENIMIVDLVRNDLSKTAKKGSVKVEELCGIYTFETVHQMISTVVSEVKEGVHPVEVVKAAFPMGSMTGAPKFRAMELIERYESARRGLYSGAVGYFTPEGDFDFNVVIRSILYNASNRYLSIMAGGAITAGSDPQKEYEESLLKAKAMFKALGVDP